MTLYGGHMPEERIAGSKIDLDLSVGSTNMLVFTVQSRMNYNEVMMNQHNYFLKMLKPVYFDH